jgi:hypothetical protein
MEKIKSRLLIVGDSFFSRDEKFPNQHWSEMLPGYEVDNRAVPGHSNRMILHDLVEGLTSRPDAVVIGFTGPSRIEFKNPNPEPDFDRLWMTSQHHQRLTQDQKLLMTLYQSLTEPVWENFGAFWQIIGALSFLKSQNIPFVYSLGIYQKLIPVTELLLPHSHIVNIQLSKFSSYALVNNLATYPLELQTNFDPLFHVPDPVWQSNFANEVITKLKMLDI